jgi:hypothetical protein
MTVLVKTMSPRWDADAQAQLWIVLGKRLHLARTIHRIDRAVEAAQRADVPFANAAATAGETK